MNYLTELDVASRSAHRAVILCILASLLGLGMVHLTTLFGDFPLTGFLLFLFGALMLDYTAQGRRKTFEPGSVFITFLVTAAASGWIVSYFFINAGVGPFSDEWWTVPNMLGHVAFGLTVPVLMGGVVGLTYSVAHRHSARPKLIHGLFLLAAIGFIILWVSVFESSAASYVAGEVVYCHPYGRAF